MTRSTMTPDHGARLRQVFERSARDRRAVLVAYLTFGDPDGQRLYIAPMFYHYLDNSENPEIARYIGLTQRSPATDSIGRVKLFKLAWDAVGSEFGSRHLQYEMFYAGANMVTRGHAFRTCDWGRAVGLVDNLMSRYELPQTEPQKGT